jgi:predicted porin
MNKNIIVAAILAAATGAAAAQTGVTIYGIADAGFVRETGGKNGSINKLTSGVGSSSRLGFRGTEDLGGGLSAIYNLELGYRIDTGELDNTNNALFNRLAIVGLKSTAGTVTLGRQYTPWHNALAQVADPFGTGFAGGSKTLFPDSGANVRTNNSVLYTTPVMMGFTADASYSAGEQAGSSEAGRQLGASLGYSAGPLNVRLAYNHRNSDVAATPGVAGISRGIATNTILAANYDFKVVKAYAAYNVNKGVGSSPYPNASNPYGDVQPQVASTDSNDLLLGLNAPVGPGNLLATYMRKNDKNALNQDANSWGVGYLYPLSKRTTLYTVYGTVNNKNGADYTVANNTESGSGDKAYNIGVRHTF